MSTIFDEEKFKKYFHYGLDYKNEDIFDILIMESTNRVNRISWKNDKVDKIRMVIDIASSLNVQFFRFVQLAEDGSKNWYKSIKKENVEESIENRIDYLKQNGVISIVNYIPMRGIYITDRDPGANKLNITGQQYYENLPNWIKDDIIPMLDYLEELEQKNQYQYMSLFLDMKYARSVNSGNQVNMDKIKSLYTLFLEKVKPAKKDIYMNLENDISVETKKYIEENFPEYWTITDLKDIAKSEKYLNKVNNHCEFIKSRFNKDDLDLNLT